MDKKLYFLDKSLLDGAKYLWEGGYHEEQS